MLELAWHVLRELDSSIRTAETRGNWSKTVANRKKSDSGRIAMALGGFFFQRSNVRESDDLGFPMADKFAGEENLLDDKMILIFSHHQV